MHSALRMAKSQSLQSSMRFGLFHIDFALKISAPLFGPQGEKTCLWGFANNTGADQPAHWRSLISAFVIPFLESNICKLATGEISIF